MVIVLGNYVVIIVFVDCIYNVLLFVSLSDIQRQRYEPAMCSICMKNIVPYRLCSKIIFLKDNASTPVCASSIAKQESISILEGGLRHRAP